jgi:hypothetical protein
MKLSHLFGIILALSLFILASCEYKPKGDYFRDLVPIPPDYVNITVPGYSDTLFVYSSGQMIRAKVDCGSRKVLFYRISINGVQKSIQAVSNNNFDFSPGACVSADGIYRMSLEVGINTGSGSIADVLKAEGYIFKKDFILAALLGQYTITPDLRFSRQGGALKLSLDLPPDVTIVKKVTFSRTIPYENKDYVIESLTGTLHYETTDPLYVGQYSNYNVQTYAVDSSGTLYIPYIKGSCSVSYDLPSVTTGATASGFPLLKWSKTHYPANCGGYRIYNTAIELASNQLLKTINDINDTVFEAAGVPFPGYYELRVAPFPKPLPDWYTDQVDCNSFSANEATGYSGLGSFQFTNFFAPPGPFLYYSVYTDVINQYSAETGLITDVIKPNTGYLYIHSFTVSPNGKYLLATTGPTNFQYYFYDLTTRQSTLLSSSQVIGSGATGGAISVSDNGLASIVSEDRMVVYDFLHQNQVVQHTFGGSLVKTLISADGQYIFAKSDYLFLFQLSSGALQQKWSSAGIAGTISYFNFMPSQASKALLFTDRTFSVMNCETLAVEGSYVMDIDNICNIDFGNSHILGKTKTDFKVYDLVTGSLQFQNLLGNNLDYQRLQFKKNTIYYSEGKKLVIF